MMAPSCRSKLTDEILAVLVHVRSVPKKITLIVDLVEDLEALGVGFRLAVEGALLERHIVSTFSRGSLSKRSTHQAHGTITDPVDLWPVLAEFGGGQLA